MPIDIDKHLVETATKVVVTRNEYGDTQYGATSSVSCLFRDISTLNRLQNRNEVQIDGLLWFGADQTVKRGDVFYHASVGYLKIEKIINAKQLVLGGAKQFVKCEVIKIRQIS